MDIWYLYRRYLVFELKVFVSLVFVVYMGVVCMDFDV